MAVIVGAPAFPEILGSVAASPTWAMVGLVAAFFGVALVYSAAGFGGGSSYLALLTLVMIDHHMIRSIALTCNLSVVVGSVWIFQRKGLIVWRWALPLVMASVPMAYWGASIDVPRGWFYRVLAVTLVVASILMMVPRRGRDGGGFPHPEAPEPGRPTPKGSRRFAMAVGASIGFLSGLVGIGGGIFLSPALHLVGKDHSKRIAALAAFFILVNSLSGIAGLLHHDRFDVGGWYVVPLILAVVAGGQIGARTNLAKLNLRQVRNVTAVVVLIAGLRLLFV